MQVEFENIGPMEVTIDIKHEGVDELRAMDLRSVTSPITVTKGMTLTVVIDDEVHQKYKGEIEYLLIQYAGVTHKVPVEKTKDGGYKPVVLFNGDRDFWTNVLRNTCKSI